MPAGSIKSAAFSGDAGDLAAEMRTFAARAKRIPSLESVFRNLYLNQPVAADHRFLPSADWDASQRRSISMRWPAMLCGLDLSSIQDLMTLILVFPNDDDPPSYDVLCWFWSAGIPFESAGARDRVPYALWRDQCILHAPPGL